MTRLTPLPVDVTVENVLLRPYDLEGLAARIARSTERRVFLSGVAAGAALFAPLAAIGVLAAGLHPGSAPAPAPAPTRVAVATVSVDDDVCAMPAPGVETTFAPCPLVAAPHATAAPAASARPIVTPADAPVTKRVFERTESRLQRDLAWYARARAAFDDGDWNVAANEARALRLNAPGGALVVEAGVMQANALLRAGQRSEAAAVARTLLDEPAAKDKVDELLGIVAAADGPTTNPAPPKERAPPRLDDGDDNDDDDEQEEDGDGGVRGGRRGAR